MAFMTWKETFALGNLLIDAQHRQLIDLVNELHAAMLQDSEPPVLHLILEKLLAHTHLHFNTEERIMQSADYPDFAAHKAQHDQLAEQVLGYVEELQSGRVTLTMRTCYFLEDWLERHILESDHDLGGFMERLQTRSGRMSPSVH